jgi:transglutaminase-like putative cysteine protease
MDCIPKLKTKLATIFWVALITGLGLGCQADRRGQEEAGAGPVTVKASIEDVEAGIRAYIRAKTEEGDGYFNLQDDSLNLSLKLVRVHTEYLSVLGPREFFACVDLATVEGDVYDVDFFLSGEPGDMQVTRTDVHKLNGRPFYTWKKDKDNTWYTVPVAQATNELLGVRHGIDRFTFTYEMELPDFSTEAKVWIPLAASDRFQKILLKHITAPARCDTLYDEEHGNAALYWQLTPEHRGKRITVVYEVERLEKSAYLAPEEDFSVYLDQSPLLPVGGRFADIANEVIAEKQADNPLEKARALYDYIIDNMRYAKQGTYGTADANYACDARSGNCTEFHSLFISLARSAGIPARFAVGAAIPSERDEGGVDGYHCWAEFYAEGKWWPVDISEANKYTALATYYFGHHPANRIELSRGRDLRLKPAPATGPIPFFAYPVLEVDGREQRAKTTFSFERKLEKS